MNLKASIAAVVLGLVAGAGCSSPAESPKPAAGVVETTTTTAPAVQAVSFSSCAEAAAAGYHDMTRGAPGYSARLDGDGDGVACDQKKAATTSTTLAKPALTVGGMTAAECDAYAAKQTRLNPGSTWTARMDGTDCVVTPG